MIEQSLLLMIMLMGAEFRTPRFLRVPHPPLRKVETTMKLMTISLNLLSFRKWDSSSRVRERETIRHTWMANHIKETRWHAWWCYVLLLVRKSLRIEVRNSKLKQPLSQSIMSWLFFGQRKGTQVCTIYRTSIKLRFPNIQWMPYHAYGGCC